MKGRALLEHTLGRVVLLAVSHFPRVGVLWVKGEGERDARPCMSMSHISHAHKSHMDMHIHMHMHMVTMDMDYTLDMDMDEMESQTPVCSHLQSCRSRARGALRDSLA